MQTPVNTVVVAAAAGDDQALARLIDQHLPLTYTVAALLLEGGPTVAEAVNETMIRMVRDLPTLSDPDRFRGWLAGLTVRTVRELTSPRAQAGFDPTRRTSREAAIGRTGWAGRELVEAAGWLDASGHVVLALWWLEAAGAIDRVDLALALGLSRRHATVRVQRLRTDLAGARTGLRLARGIERCDELDSEPLDASPSPAVESCARIVQHVRTCHRCQEASRCLPPPEPLMSEVGLLIPPAGLRPGRASPARTVATGPPRPRRERSSSPPEPSPTTTTERDLPLPGLKSAVAVGLALALAGWLFAGIGPQPRPSPEARAAPAPAPTPSVQVASPTAALASTSPRLIEPVATTRKPDERAEPAKHPRAGQAVTAADLYVAPDGDDAASGTASQPYASLARAVALAQPGQTIAVRGGRYRPTEPLRISASGTADKPITVSNYRHEKPLFDASQVTADKAFVIQTGSYWTVQGLEIENAAGGAYECQSCRGVTFRRLDLHDNGANAMILKGEGTSDNQVLDSDFHDNHDDAQHGADADGLAIKFGSGDGNLVRGCRFWDNADDGLDLHKFTSAVTVESSWSFGNGVNRWNIDGFEGLGNGFKLGGGDVSVAHVSRDNASWENAGPGFTEASNTGPILVTSNTAFHNGRDGFAFYHSPATLEHNLAVANDDGPVEVGESAKEYDNSWNRRDDGDEPHSDGASAAAAPRSVDGALPEVTFLTSGPAGLGASMKDPG